MVQHTPVLKLLPPEELAVLVGSTRSNTQAAWLQENGNSLHDRFRKTCAGLGSESIPPALLSLMLFPGLRRRTG